MFAAVAGKVEDRVSVVTRGDRRFVIAAGTEFAAAVGR